MVTQIKHSITEHKPIITHFVIYYQCQLDSCDDFTARVGVEMLKPDIGCHHALSNLPRLACLHLDVLN